MAEVSQEHKPHASSRFYVVIALILTVITAAEVMVFYVEYLKPVLVPILLVLAASKFALVVMFFMHLRFDSRIFTAIFVGPLLIAVAVIIAMLALYGVFTGGAAG
jgi:cytochrome c oxidase subunit 4